jgi:hypothetical protein
MSENPVTLSQVRRYAKASGDPWYRAVALACGLRGDNEPDDRDTAIASIACARVLGKTGPDDPTWAGIAISTDGKYAARACLCNDGNVMLTVAKRGHSTLFLELAALDAWTLADAKRKFLPPVTIASRLAEVAQLWPYWPQDEEVVEKINTLAQQLGLLTPPKAKA